MVKEAKATQAMRKLLCETILNCETAEDLETLFEDLCTYKEVEQMAQRVAAAQMLGEGKTYAEIIEKTGSKENIVLDAGYPFHIGTLAESLKFSANDEKNETEDIYPAFSLTAKEEGFEDVAALFKMVAEVEAQHKIVFQYLHDAVRNGTLYKSEKPVLWICSECGHMHVATEAWKVCPLCKAEQGYVDLHLPFEGVRE